MNTVFQCLMLIVICISCSQNHSEEYSPQRKKAIDHLFKKGKDMADNEDYEHAYSALNKAKDLYLEIHDSISMVNCLVEMAIIQEYQSDFLGSIETSLGALKLCNNKTPKETYYKIYNNLGVNSMDIKNYTDAKQFYQKALDLSSTELDKLKVQHNLAVVYFYEKNYKAAEQTERQILSNLHKKNDTYYKVSIHHARYMSHLHPNYNPIPIFNKAIDYSIANNNLWGLDACYYYVSEYYYNRKPDSALAYAHKNYKVATKLKASLDRLDALENIIKLENKALPYFDIYNKLADSLEAARNSSKNQFAVIRFESEKNLNEKMKLEKKMDEKNDQMLLGSALVLLSITGGFWMYRYRQQKIKKEAENKIKEDRFLISKKVHDVVANGIYQVMSSIEHHQNFNKEEVLDKLDDMYQKSRDISHDKLPVFLEDNIQNQISELAQTFQNENVQVFLVGNEISTWKSVPLSIQKELYPIILELFVNTKKHSSANRILLKLNIDNQLFTIKYTDNGCGKEQISNKGMGMNSIIQKVKSHHGTIEYGIQQDKPGFFVTMSFPL